MTDEARTSYLRKALPSVLSNIVQGVIGGMVLALLFFVAREVWFPLPSVDGRWTVETHTTKTAYGPYQDMRVRYIALIWREGPVIKGTMEKVSEITTSRGTVPYIGEERTRGEIEGYIHKLYFSKDRVAFHIVEGGSERESTTLHDVTVADKDRMVGTFIATAADSEGDVVWQRSPP